MQNPAPAMVWQWCRSLSHRSLEFEEAGVGPDAGSIGSPWQCTFSTRPFFQPTAGGRGAWSHGGGGAGPIEMALSTEP
eukprot:gene11060-biopygen4825